MPFFASLPFKLEDVARGAVQGAANGVEGDMMYPRLTTVSKKLFLCVPFTGSYACLYHMVIYL